MSAIDKKHKQSDPPKNFLYNNKLFFIVLSLLIILVYGRTTQFEYLGFDDTLLIVDNYNFIKDLSNIPAAFNQDVFNVHDISKNSSSFYRPLLTVSFMMDAQLGGSFPKMYHFSNIIYHILSCIFLFYLLEQIGMKQTIAKVLTLLFAIHPIMTMAIAWIPGRNDVLLGLFGILSFIHFIKYTDSKSIKNLLMHLLFFMLALFTKENALMLVPVCFLHLILIKKELKFSLSLLGLTIGYSIILFTWYLMRASALKGSPPIDTSFAVLVHRALSNIPLLFQYVNKIILPVNLSGLSTVEETNYWLAGIALILIGIALYFTKEKRWNYILFGFLWFLGFLSLTLLSPAPEVGGVEHRTYLPLIGLLICIGETDIMKNLQSRNNTASLYLTILLLLTFLGITISNVGDFKNRFVFWENFLKEHPDSAKGWVTLGGFNKEIGNYDKALEQYKAAERCNSKIIAVHFFLGELYMLENKNEEAALEFKKELEVHPDNSSACNNLGLVYKNMGRMEDAVKAYQQGLAINPKEQKIHNNIAIIYAQQKRYEDAEKEFKDEIGINPTYADAYYNLGVLYETIHKEKEMVEMWEQTVKIDPGHKNAGNALKKLWVSVHGKQIAGKRNDVKAIDASNNMSINDNLQSKNEEAFKKELARHPDNTFARYNLSLVYQKMGRMEDAVKEWEKLLTVDKNFTPAYKNLAEYYKKLNNIEKFNYYTQQAEEINKTQDIK